MKRVLLTGGTGFVGSNLARHLLNEGHEVHLLVRHDYQAWRISDIRSEIGFWEARLDDQSALVEPLRQIRPDWIFHLAAYGAYPHQVDLQQMVKTNVLGTMNLIQAALERGFEAFVNAGSSSEYGLKDHAPAEDEALEPNSPYAVTKASATLFCQHTARARGMQIPTLRLYSAFGPYEEPTRLMPTLVVKGMQGKLPPLVDPNIARDYIYTADVCKAFISAATNRLPDPGGIYNLGSGIQTTLAQVVDTAKRLLGLSMEPEWGSMAPRTWDTNVWVANTRKIREELGWSPLTTVEEGLEHLIAWFRDQPDHLNYYKAKG